MTCKAIKAQLADLLLDPSAASPVAREHLAACPECGRELRELQAAMLALDAWEAPEPSPYFDTRLAARLREERANPPAGWWERMRTRILFGSGVPLRPVAAGALALLLMMGGGTAFLLQQSSGSHPATPQESAAVHDLQLLDGNAQVYQQMSALDSDLDGSDSATGN